MLLSGIAKKMNGQQGGDCELRVVTEQIKCSLFQEINLH